MNVRFKKLTKSTIGVYLKVGIKSYNQHYLHLWEDGDAKAFIDENLTEKALSPFLNDSKQFFFIIYWELEPVGILKLTLDSDKGAFISNRNVLLNKIYLLKEYSGKGIGKKTLAFVENFAIKKNRSWVWLYAMKKGRAKGFYQKNGYKIVGEAAVELPKILNTEKEMWSMARKISTNLLS